VVDINASGKGAPGDTRSKRRKFLIAKTGEKWVGAEMVNGDGQGNLSLSLILQWMGGNKKPRVGKREAFGDRSKMLRNYQ
jgi:hypothetical protein